jgi:hypothetical protein
VPRDRSLRHLSPLQHRHRERQDLVAIPVDVIGNRPQDDAAAVVGVDFLLVVGAAMDALSTP